ncbi:helix-turn-helix domain-containing protein [Phytoactinopolyspora limicola]|uniref:helix-turn-helix domain-containing protein n=1 Tax=Phytoactinopolyspora limicola TaxID=2715536 RepID=UPI0014099E7B|nr:helix-turn-helix transcriptional regulator [Phytoactinopolyspora limicola]
MHGTPASPETATDDRLVLRRDVFDRLTAKAEAVTVAQQAALTGVPERTLYRIRRGDAPGLTSAMRISDALGVPLNVLFKRIPADGRTQ